jgi:hypothetical protein
VQVVRRVRLGVTHHLQARAQLWLLLAAVAATIPVLEALAEQAQAPQAAELVAQVERLQIALAAAVEVERLDTQAQAEQVWQAQVQARLEQVEVGLVEVAFLLIHLEQAVAVSAYLAKVLVALVLQVEAAAAALVVVMGLQQVVFMAVEAAVVRVALGRVRLALKVRFVLFGVFAVFVELHHSHQQMLAVHNFFKNKQWNFIFASKTVNRLNTQSLGITSVRHFLM